jgi:hypothetical protein
VVALHGFREFFVSFASWRLVLWGQFVLWVLVKAESKVTGILGLVMMLVVAMHGFRVLMSFSRTGFWFDLVCFGLVLFCGLLSKLKARTLRCDTLYVDVH